MMLVVSDSSPLNILIRLELVHILPLLFDTVTVPTAVAEELIDPSAPEVVRSWIGDPPTWLTIQSPAQAVDPAERHRGEKDAISLALELHADAILLDELKPRRDAAAVGLVVIGTVRILERAANAGWIYDLSDVHIRLKATDFRIDHAILHASLQRHIAGRRGSR